MSGLAGRRVVVTRARAQAAPFVRALEDAGAVPVLLPLLEIAPPEDPGPAEAALDRVATFDWVVLTSANAARAFADVWERRGRPPLPRVAAVGPVTAGVARSAGLTVDAQARTFRGRAIPAALGEPAGRTVLLPRSDLGRDETTEALVAAGARVEDVIFYRTGTASPDRQALSVLDDGIDVLTFFSPSAVRAFVALLGEDARRLAAGATVACIGPVTADAARAAGLTVSVQPATFTGEALVRALEEA